MSDGIKGSIKGEHVGGCNEKCEGDMHYFEGSATPVTVLEWQRTLDCSPLVEVAKHTLDPADVIVVRVLTADIGTKWLDTLREAIAYVFPGHRALVVGPEVELHVVAPAMADEIADAAAEAER